MNARLTELLDAARQIAYFGETDLKRLRRAVAEVDEWERSYPDEEEGDE